jgi:hypothetical protein
MNAADSMQLISIVIAVNALISGLFLWGMNKNGKDVQKNMADIQNHSRFLFLLTNQLVEWMISKEVYDKSERGMIYAVLASLGKSAELDRFSKIMFAKRLECKRNLQHLMLYSNNSTRRDSAHKQLVNAYGNADTLRVLEELSVVVKHGELHQIPIAELRKRINDSLNSLV